MGKDRVYSGNPPRVIFIALVLLSSAGWSRPARQSAGECPGAGRPVAFKSIARGVVGQIQERGETVIRNEKDWKALWKRLGLPLNPPPPTPVVDFSKEMILGVFAGQGREILDIEIKRAERRTGCLLVTVSERRVPPNVPSNQFGAFRPFHLIRLNAGPERVVFQHIQIKS